VRTLWWEQSNLSNLSNFNVIDDVILFQGIVHFEINFLYVLAYLKGIQDVDVFVSTVFSILIFLGLTVLVCQSYNAGVWGPPQKACTEKSILNMI